MAVRLFSDSSVVLMAAMLLSACSGTPGADHIIAQPESVQRQALLSCQAQQGINRPDALNVLRLNSGGVIVSMVNGPNVSLAQARAINQCARARLLSGQTSVAEVPYTPVTYETVPEQAAYEQSAPLARTQKTQEPWVDDTVQHGCIQGGGAIQKGSLICPGY